MPEVFWTLTPLEYSRIMRAWHDRRADEFAIVQWSVWTGEALQRTKRLPDFDRFTRRADSAVAPQGQADEALFQKALRFHLLMKGSTG